MPFCTKCGTEIKESANFCNKCGNARPNRQISIQKIGNGSSFGFALLGFLFPYVGLVVYFIIKEEKPLIARSCIKGVIWGVVLTVIFGFIYFTWF